MKLYQLWQNNYRNCRYMEFLSKTELEERKNDIFSNAITLSDQGQISLHDIYGQGEYWMQLWTHILVEFQLRYGPHPNGFTNGFIANPQIVKPTYPEPPNAFKAIQAIGGCKEGAIYKFGKYKHLKEMFEKGEIRIAPASFYNDPSLNNAIRDDELSIGVHRRADRIAITQMNGSKIPAFGNVRFRLESKTNYYVHCFATNYTNREFDDFDADSCIVIYEPRLLFQKMMKAVKQLKPEFDGFASSVTYIDPLNVDPKNVDIFFAKHFKYSYQNEVRTIWLPKAPLTSLEPFFISVGEMKNYAKILRI